MKNEREREQPERYVRLLARRITCGLQKPGSGRTRLRMHPKVQVAGEDGRHRDRPGRTSDSERDTAIGAQRLLAT